MGGFLPERCPVRVDSRIGSKEMLPRLVKLGLPAELATLPFGDAAFLGEGPDGPLRIGVERKTLRDFLSSMHTGRLSGHQVPGMSATFARSYLILEARAKEDKESGALLEWSGRTGEWQIVRLAGRVWPASAITRYLLSLEEFAGFRICRTHDLAGTCQVVRDLWKWWGRPYDGHDSHQAKTQTPNAVGSILRRPPLVARMACELPGVGQKRALAAAQVFNTPLEMVTASVESWLTVEGVGAASALKAVEANQGRDLQKGK